MRIHVFPARKYFLHIPQRLFTFVVVREPALARRATTW